MIFDVQVHVYVTRCLNSKAGCGRFKESNVEYKFQSTAMFICLPAPCCDFTSLVALSMHTMRQPVTFGSRVPL